MTLIEVNDDLEFKMELREMFGPAGFEIWKKYYMEFSDYWKFCQCGCDQICKTGEHLKEPRRQMMQMWVNEFYPGQNAHVNADATRIEFGVVENVEAKAAIAQAKHLSELLERQQNEFNNRLASVSSAQQSQVARLEALLSDTQASAQAEISEFRTQLESKKEQEVEILAAQMQEAIARAETRSRELEQAIAQARNSEAQMNEFVPSRPLELPTITEVKYVELPPIEKVVHQVVEKPVIVEKVVRVPAQQAQPINIPWKAIALMGTLAAMTYAVPMAVESVNTKIEAMRIAGLEKEIATLTRTITEMKLEAESEMAACQASYSNSLGEIEAIADQVESLKSQIGGK